MKTAQNYKEKTIAAIREHGGRLASFSDADITNLYSDYSCSRMSASWLYFNKESIEDFSRWATTAPCDLIKPE